MNAQELKRIGRGIEVIVCDLDQTLLNSQKQISQKNLDAIRTAQAEGIFVTICSGRIFTMLEPYSRDLAINGPIISTNGAAILNSRDGQVLTAHSVDRQAALAILDFAKDCDYDYAALTPSACYFSTNSIRVQKFLQYNDISASRAMKLIPIVYFKGNNEIVEDDIYKILIQELHPGELAAASSFLNQIHGVSVTSSEKGLLDVMKAGVNKGTGVVELRQILGVEKEQVCVFGDYLNDLPMFYEAGLPIAMENAHQTLKDHALAITSHYDEDGIAKAMYDYIL